MNPFLILFLLTVLCFKECYSLQIAIRRRIVQQRVLTRVISVNPAALFNYTVKVLVVMVSQCNHGWGTFVAVQGVDGADLFLEEHLKDLDIASACQ